MDQNKLKKQVRVIDMMISMHSILADRYAKRSKLLEISTFFISLFLVSFTFFDTKLLKCFNLEEDIVKFILGLSSILIFFISILSLIVDWKGKSVQHKDGFFTLSKLKTEWNDRIANIEKMNKRDIQDFSKNSSLVINHLTPIPDKLFNKLKSQHYKKVELSKMISNYPGTPIILLKALILYKSILVIFQKGIEEREQK